MKIITWNINRASYVRKSFWEYFEKLNFDIGMFQEVCVIPYKIREKYTVVRGEMNAILIKKSINAKIKRTNILEEYSKNKKITDFCTSCEIRVPKKTISIINIYNYIGSIESEVLEILDTLYNYLSNNKEKVIIIGGDLDMDEKFQGKYYKWGLIMKHVKENLFQLGYREVLSNQLGSSPYTFISPANKKQYQLDYLFIPKKIKLLNAKVGSKFEILDRKPRLSDHLPILAEIVI